MTTHPTLDLPIDPKPLYLILPAILLAAIAFVQYRPDDPRMREIMAGLARRAELTRKIDVAYVKKTIQYPDEELYDAEVFERQKRELSDQLGETSPEYGIALRELERHFRPAIDFIEIREINEDRKFRALATYRSRPQVISDDGKTVSTELEYVFDGEKTAVIDEDSRKFHVMHRKPAGFGVNRWGAVDLAEIEKSGDVFAIDGESVVGGNKAIVLSLRSSRNPETVNKRYWVAPELGWGVLRAEKFRDGRLIERVNYMSYRREDKDLYFPALVQKEGYRTESDGTLRFAEKTICQVRRVSFGEGVRLHDGMFAVRHPGRGFTTSEHLVMDN